MRKTQVKQLDGVMIEAIQKLSKKTMWIDALEDQEFLAFRVLKINGRKYLLIPKNIILHHINDDLRLIEERL